METKIYPVVVAHLGGATLARVGSRITSVQVAGRVFKVPTSEVRMVLDDGMAIAEVAKTYAYRNA